METGQLKYLQENENDPEKTDLKIIWDGIMKEYQTLTNREDYTMTIRKTVSDLQKHNRLNGLIACYHLMRYNIDVRSDLKYWGIEKPNIQILEQKILQERTKLNIEIIQKSNKETKKEDFDRLTVLVENALNRNLDVDNISVKKWVYLCKSIEDKARQIEQINSKHGRQNKK
jgi:hypothetical protein